MLFVNDNLRLDSCVDSLWSRGGGEGGALHPIFGGGARQPLKKLTQWDLKITERGENGI